MERQRSPSYPSLSLEQAIDMAAKLHKSVRTNVVSRETAAKDMGYTGLTGRSLTVLAALAQYGLVERAGKGDIKVTRRAVEILHPVEETHRIEAIRDAATAPTLFRDITERFPDGMPSGNALRSYLVQRDFNDVAIGQAIDAFLDTNAYVAKTEESGRTGGTPGNGDDEAPKPTSQEPAVNSIQIPPALPPTPPPGLLADAVLNKISMNIAGDRVMVSGLLDLKGLRLLKKKIAGLEALLAPDDEDASPVEEDDDI